LKSRTSPSAEAKAEALKLQATAEAAADGERVMGKRGVDLTRLSL